MANDTDDYLHSNDYYFHGNDYYHSDDYSDADMKKQKRFVIAEATLDEVNKQLRLNLFVIVVIMAVLTMNVIHFIKEQSLFYAALVAMMVLLLFLIIKARRILKLRQRALIK